MMLINADQFMYLLLRKLLKIPTLTFFITEQGVGRALDSHANGSSLSKVTELNLK